MADHPETSFCEKSKTPEGREKIIPLKAATMMALLQGILIRPMFSIDPPCKM
jgi:hypothetical protein